MSALINFSEAFAALPQTLHPGDKAKISPCFFGWLGWIGLGVFMGFLFGWFWFWFGLVCFGLV